MTFAHSSGFGRCPKGLHLCKSRRSLRTGPWPDRGGAPSAVLTFEEGEVAIPTIACFKGGLRPGDEVEFYVRESDTGEELVIRRRG